MERECKQCLGKFEGKRNAQWCPSCGKARTLARTAEWSKANRRKGTSLLSCQRCAVSFEAKRNDAKYCLECAPTVRREQMAAWEQGNPDRRKKTQAVIVCQRCGLLVENSGRSDRKWCFACRNPQKTAARKEREGRTCLDCGTLISWASVRCRSCRGKTLGGAGSVNFKGGRRIRSGYWQVLVGPKRYVAEHRLVYEQAYGPIPAGYHIHHKNGDKLDNRIENLVAMTRSEHHKVSHTTIAELQAKIKELEARLNS